MATLVECDDCGREFLPHEVTACDCGSVVCWDCFYTNGHEDHGELDLEIEVTGEED